tara:strand:+ start:417 stop:551 length:135 start_codon:yes stop_codon:yes gene_type:complete
MARSEHHPNGLIHYNPQLSYPGLEGRDLGPDQLANLNRLYAPQA